MKEEAKKKWGKPKLIILTRGKPDERVLMACKGNDPSAHESISEHASCLNPLECAECTGTTTT